MNWLRRKKNDCESLDHPEIAMVVRGVISGTRDQTGIDKADQCLLLKQSLLAASKNTPFLDVTWLPHYSIKSSFWCALHQAAGLVD